MSGKQGVVSLNEVKSRNVNSFKMKGMTSLANKNNTVMPINDDNSISNGLMNIDKNYNQVLETEVLENNFEIPKHLQNTKRLKSEEGVAFPLKQILANNVITNNIETVLIKGVVTPNRILNPSHAKVTPSHQHQFSMAMAANKPLLKPSSKLLNQPALDLNNQAKDLTILNPN